MFMLLEIVQLALILLIAVMQLRINASQIVINTAQLKINEWLIARQ